MCAPHDWELCLLSISRKLRRGHSCPRHIAHNWTRFHCKYTSLRSIRILFRVQSRRNSEHTVLVIVKILINSTKISTKINKNNNNSEINFVTARVPILVDARCLSARLAVANSAVVVLRYRTCSASRAKICCQLVFDTYRFIIKKWYRKKLYLNIIFLRNMKNRIILRKNKEISGFEKSKYNSVNRNGSVPKQESHLGRRSHRFEFPCYTLCLRRTVRKPRLHRRGTCSPRYTSCKTSCYGWGLKMRCRTRRIAWSCRTLCLHIGRKSCRLRQDMQSQNTLLLPKNTFLII